jgi:hypothetical protein
MVDDCPYGVRGVTGTGEFYTSRRRFRDGTNLLCELLRVANVDHGDTITITVQKKVSDTLEDPE